MAGHSAIPAFITTVLGLLNVAAVNTVLGCAVYDHVPQNAAYPFIALQSPSEVRDDVMGRADKQVFIEAHVFTSSEQTKGSEQASAIASKVCELTDYPTVSVSGWTVDAIRNDGWFDAGDESTQRPVIKHYVVTIHGWFRPS